MGKIKLYIVSMCTVDSDSDTFIDNLCTIVSSKKEITEYVKNKIIEDHKEHYNSWIKLHDKKDNSATRAEYIDLLFQDDPDSIPMFTVRKETYDAKGLASVFRIYNRCMPIGCSYESNEEVYCYNKINEELKNLKDKATNNIVDVQKE